MRALLPLLLTFPAFGQLWSGVLDSSRAIDWSNAGVSGGIPARATQCGSTIAAYGSSGTPGAPTTINNAINACTSGQHVQLGAGTFYLNSGIVLASGVTVRGAGADQTIIIYKTSTAFCNGYTALVCMAGGNSGPNGESNVCDWTAGYSVGTTSITLANCGSTTPAVGSISNLAIGSVLILDQVDELNDPGAIWNCDAGSGASNSQRCAQEGTGSFARTNGTTVNGIAARSQQQVVTVTGISGGTITISPGLYMPNWTSTQKPQAWFASTVIHDAGVEDLSISMDDGATDFSQDNITMMNCNQCWVKGVRSLYAERAHVKVSQCVHCSVVDSYFYQAYSHATQSYTLEVVNTSDFLAQNNIGQQVTDSLPTCNGGCEGIVAAYNFCINTQYNATGWFQSCNYLHASGGSMNLFEGNFGTGFTADDIHGTNHFTTLYRNFLPGWQLTCNPPSPGPCQYQTQAVDLMAGSRYFNIIGNVLGTPSYHTNYNCVAASTSTCANSPVSIYSLGYTGTQSSSFANVTGYCINAACASTVGYDSLTATYLMRWGNADAVNTFTPQWNSSEVPSGIAVYSNPVPANHNLPNSFYLSAKPTSWWGTAQWPPIGPDVTSGTVGQCSGTYALVAAIDNVQCTGGSKVSAYGSFAYPIPAVLCAYSTMGMPVDGSGGPLAFNASTCYTASPSTPTVTTITAISITSSSASSGGNVTSDGGSSVTSRGVCYSTSANPTTPCTSDGTGTGTFTSSLNGLSASTTYHYRSFATNANGTSYGTDLTFTTSGPSFSGTNRGGPRKTAGPQRKI